MSNNLGRTNVVVNQANKETTIATSDDALDAAITSSITFTWAGAETAKTASTAQTQGNVCFVMAGATSGSPTFKFGNVQRGLVIVQNTMGVTVPVSDFAGTNTVNVPAGETMIFYVTGSGLELVFASATGSTASTTEVLTGTDSTKFVTPDALAALWEQGSDIASAATITVGEGGYFNVTGTTTITDIDLGVDTNGRLVALKFAGALTLTHNASTLILPGSANITTAAGDVALFVSEGADAVRCVGYTRASGRPVRTPVAFVIAVSDETTALTTGTAKVTFRAPHAFVVTGVRASLTTAQTSGSTLAVDINESGVSILSTTLTIDNGEKTSTTAASAAVISDSSIADDAEITIDIDTIGDGTAKGLKVYLNGYRTT